MTDNKRKPSQGNLVKNLGLPTLHVCQTKTLRDDNADSEDLFSFLKLRSKAQISGLLK